MKTRSLVLLLCSFDVMYCYMCESAKSETKSCIEPRLHCLPIYPDWNNYEVVCSNAKSFVPGTCPVLLKWNITSVPCPDMYYTDVIYRSNEIDIPKLKRICIGEGQLTYITSSTLDNLCYCGKDYLADLPLQKNETYCDPTLRNCSCHRKTTNNISKDEGADLQSIYITVATVFSILLVSILGLSLKCRRRQTQQTVERDTNSGWSNLIYSYSANSEEVDMNRVQVPDTREYKDDSTQHITETKDKEERTCSQENIDINVHAQNLIQQERSSIQVTPGESDTLSRSDEINNRPSENSRDNTNEENYLEEPDNMDLPRIGHGTSPLNISAVKVLKPSLGKTTPIYDA
ncbi:uncharacterized protein [Mytilus edulis]|uniref:uncharacterized protein n=1 Tax=Mytilus edulis TaxID=6550 RepID=UPI0039F02717